MEYLQIGWLHELDMFSYQTKWQMILSRSLKGSNKTIEELKKEVISLASWVSNQAVRHAVDGTFYNFEVQEYFIKISVNFLFIV